MEVLSSPMTDGKTEAWGGSDLPMRAHGNLQLGLGSASLLPATLGVGSSHRPHAQHECSVGSVQAARAILSLWAHWEGTP